MLMTVVLLAVLLFWTSPLLDRTTLHFVSCMFGVLMDRLIILCSWSLNCHKPLLVYILIGILKQWNVVCLQEMKVR